MYELIRLKDIPLHLLVVLPSRDWLFIGYVHESLSHVYDSPNSTSEVY